MDSFKLELGQEGVRDRITGFTGTVTGRAEYLTGCRQYLVQPPAKKDHSEWVDGRWMDEGRLVLVSEGEETNKGGPQSCQPPTK